MKQEAINSTIATVTASAAASSGLIHFLNEHASLIGIAFTGATFSVYLATAIFDRWDMIANRSRNLASKIANAFRRDK